jgi:hypothetical protein
MGFNGLLYATRSLYGLPTVTVCIECLAQVNHSSSSLGYGKRVRE